LDDDSEAEKLSPLLVSEKCIEMTEFNTQERKENAEVNYIVLTVIVNFQIIFAIIFKLFLAVIFQILFNRYLSKLLTLLFKFAGKIVHKG